MVTKEILVKETSFSSESHFYWQKPPLVSCSHKNFGWYGAIILHEKKPLSFSETTDILTPAGLPPFPSHEVLSRVYYWWCAFLPGTRSS